MRIAFIVDVFPALSETFILNQITGLIDRGHKVDIYACTHRRDSKIHEDVFKYGLLHTTSYRPFMPNNKFERLLKGLYLFLSNLRRNPVALVRSLNIFKYGKEAVSLGLLYSSIPFIGKGPYDIIQAHFGPNGLRAIRMRELGVITAKIVTMFHGYDIRSGIQNGPKLYAKLKEDGDAFLSISPYNKQHLLRFGFEPNKIVDHPVGIDTLRFTSHWKSKLYRNHSERGTVKILTVARLVPEKGLEYGIRSIKEILKRNPYTQIQYNIVGAGEQRSQLEELTRTLNLTGVVRFMGSLDQSEVQNALCEADIFLLPSVNEALPVCLMEAQATELPVVASTVGSIDKIVRNGVSGFLVPERDVDGLAEKLIYLIEHPEVWPEMGRAGRAFIEANYDIEKLNDRLVEVYTRLLNDP